MIPFYIFGVIYINKGYLDKVFVTI